MKTKDFVLVAVGLGLGYFLFKKNPFKKKTDVEQVTSDIKEIVNDTKDTILTTIDSVKQAECQKKWTNEIGSISRFASNEAMQLSMDTYVKQCMLK